MTKNSQIAAAVEQARELSSGAPVTVVFANAAYSTVLANWIAHATAAGASNILILALDPDILALADRLRIACTLVPAIFSREELWLRRIEVFAALTEGGVDFIHSDADAIWLRLPYDRVLPTGVDFAFSQGTRWPPDIVERWGFVVCCGLFAVRASRGAARFFEIVLRRMRVDLDDQAAINRALYHEGIAWQPSSAGEKKQWNGRPFEVFPQCRFGKTADIAVALLPHVLFSRLPEVSPEALVCHPVGKEPIEDRLRRLGLWHMALSGTPASPEA